jgi:protein-disulfide isomerase
MAEANKNGLQSTPSTAVGATPVIGAQPYAQFKTAIDNELAKQ